MPNTSSKILAFAVGRRKSSRASVRLYSGSGEVTVNGKPIDKYFPHTKSLLRHKLPFEVTSSRKYSATVIATGGGVESQIDATILGISRALVKIKSEHKPLLRQHNLLTRDSRERQRRMIGMGGKSRRKKQSPKR